MTICNQVALKHTFAQIFCKICIYFSQLKEMKTEGNGI